MSDSERPQSANSVAEALYARGNELRKRGLNLDAVADYDRALTLKPDFVEVFNNRGNALRDLRRFPEALESFDRAIALNPDRERSFNNRGNVLRDLGRHHEALESFDRALEINPRYIAALINRANVLRDLSRLDDALESCERAIGFDPLAAAAHSNRGLILYELKRHAESLAALDRALELQRGDPETHLNHGNALLALDRREEALASYDRALALNPRYPGALHNRGNALLFFRRAEEALACYEAALAVRPDNAEFHYHRGTALEELGRKTEALECHRRALVLRPNYAPAIFACAHIAQDTELYDDAIGESERLIALSPDFDFALGLLLGAKRAACDWRNFAEDTASAIEAVQAGKRAIPPFSFFAMSDSPADQLSCARATLRDRHPPVKVPFWKGERYAHEKIRLAYLTADFREHPTAYLAAGLIEAHDTSRFEVTAISWSPPGPSPARDRIKSACHRFIDVYKKTDPEVAQLVRDLEIDIAIDLMGFTASARNAIFAMRPAPINVSYLGFPGTMGAGYFDYLVADGIVIPPETLEHYAEQIVTLPDTYQCTDSNRAVAERTPSRAEMGLPETGFVFASFNQNYKTTPALFDIWMRLLKEVNGSVLWLLGGNAAALRNLKHEAQARGIDPDRLIFAKRIAQDQHMARHRLADLCLDTLPYNGHTTTSDALWVGVPVVTCTGASFAGRVATSLLHAIGLPELAVSSLAEYEALALKLATDNAAHAALKEKLLRHRDTYPLFDTARFCRHFEAALTAMWQRQQAGEPPAAISIAAEM